MEHSLLRSKTIPHILEDIITSEDIANIAANEQLVLDNEDRISILKAMHSIDVQACPGSGKTTLIATKLIVLAQKWPLQNQGICVLSHTNVAKDEIIDRLKRSTIIEAQRLLSYPHFIGTIQEFVNRFLALPYIRSCGIKDIVVDNDKYCVQAIRMLGFTQFSWLSGTLNGLGTADKKEAFLKDTYLTLSSNGPEINISKRPRAWQSESNFQRATNELKRLKRLLFQHGVFLFRDMYTYSQMVCRENLLLASSIRGRFPTVLLDEMQDTQKFQDELLCTIFPLDDPDVVVQRFGDPDQAIFHGMGSEEPNESFNGKSRDEMNFVIHKSHRFDAMLADKIKHFSLNEISLESEVRAEAAAARARAHATNGDFEHTVIVFNDSARGNVVEFFARIVSNQFAAYHKSLPNFSVKVVGAVGNEIDPNSAH